MNAHSVIATFIARFTQHLSGAIYTSLLLAAFSLNANAEIYKWVDADGSIHYSDIKPNAKNATSIKTKTGQGDNADEAPESDATNTSSDDPQAKAKTMDEQEKTAQEVADRQAAMEKEATELAEKCNAIRENLKKIEENSRIRIEDQGETRYLTAEEIIEKKSTFQKTLTESCSE